MKKDFFMISFLLTFIVLGLIGCSSANQPSTNQQEKKSVDHSQHQTEEQTSQHQNGDIVETTAGATRLPAFLKGLDPQIVQVYQVAAANHALLDWMPCYCGCGESAGHKSNRDCFIREVKANGEIVWDSHGTTCGTCLSIAAESAMLKSSGKSALDIRKYIDDKYKEGFAKSTPTPMPKA